MNWEFNLPVKIVFGIGKRRNLNEYIDEIGGKRGVLVCGRGFVKNGIADEFIGAANGRLTAVFSDIRPNPTVENVDDCVRVYGAGVGREDACLSQHGGCLRKLRQI